MHGRKGKIVGRKFWRREISGREWAAIEVGR
jgi:hypothetical protein